MFFSIKIIGNLTLSPWLIGKYYNFVILGFVDDLFINKIYYKSIKQNYHLFYPVEIVKKNTSKNLKNHKCKYL